MESCKDADIFADEVFLILEGKIKDGGKCADYQLDTEQALTSIDKYKEFVKRGLMFWGRQEQQLCSYIVGRWMGRCP